MTILLLCATEAGGIRNVAPLLPVLANRNIVQVLITSRAKLSLFGDNIACTAELVLQENIDMSCILQLIADRQPVAVICGTARFGSPDREFISAGRKVGVRTIAVLDEWYDYRSRFEDPVTRNLVYLPDVVAVQDLRAKKEATAEGLPHEICHVTGSPALVEVLHSALSMRQTPPSVPELLADSAGRPIVTFLSETHAADYGTSADRPGPLGQFIGYTEVTVRHKILEILGQLNYTVVLVEKLHPAAEDGEMNDKVPRNVDFRSVRETDLWELLWYSTIVIGMRSMALLEAHILGCEVASFQPGLIGAERCTAVRLGLIPGFKYDHELGFWCDQWLQRSTIAEENCTIRQYPFAVPGAAERVVDLALNNEGRCHES